MSEQSEEAARDRLPPPPTSNPARVQLRRYEDRWAMLPTEETDGQLAPGSGPHGTVSTSGTNVAMVLLVVAFGVILLAFFVPYLPVLLSGLVLLLAAIVAFAVRERHVGTWHGVGTLKPRQQRRTRPGSRSITPETA